MEEIFNFEDKLHCIKDDLRKLGSKRSERKDYVNRKLFEAEKVYEQFNILYTKLNKDNIPEENLTICNNIKLLFDTISNYCKQKTLTMVDTALQPFDLKTASSIIPVVEILTNESIEKLICNIELYNSFVDKKCEHMIINFVLKTRLPRIARLKLSEKYDSITDLINDIKKYLLTKKTANTLLSQLNSQKQNGTSIRTFGNKLEQLFIDLSISQSNNNTELYNTLKPINENLAIRQFANGLQNKTLSTIILARNFSSLKEAIEYATDFQDFNSAQPSNNVMAYNRGQLRGNRGWNARGPPRAQTRFQVNRPPPRAAYQPPTGRSQVTVPPSRGEYRHNFNKQFNNTPRHFSHQNFSQQRRFSQHNNNYTPRFQTRQFDNKNNYKLNTLATTEHRPQPFLDKEA